MAAAGHKSSNLSATWWVRISQLSASSTSQFSFRYRGKESGTECSIFIPFNAGDMVLKIRVNIVCNYASNI